MPFCPQCGRKMLLLEEAETEERGYHDIGYLYRCLGCGAVSTIEEVERANL